MQIALRSPLRAWILVTAAGVGFAVAGCAALGQRPASGVFAPAPSEATASAGLREALQFSAERGVSRAAHAGSFLDDPRVRIPLPPELEKLGRGLREIGFHSAVDDLEVAMNRAAERAVREAQEPLAAAVVRLQIADARAILSGPGDAGTQFLRRESEPALRKRFEPVIEAAMRSAGVPQAYQQILSRNRALVRMRLPTVDMNRYVTAETLDGLFTLIGDEERRIRNDPTARTTDLLRAVFGEP